MNNLVSVYSKIKILVSGLQEELAATIGTLYGVIPNNTSADQVVTRALDTATRVNKQGLIESVVANKARIDYSLGVDRCANLLVEKTRINLIPNEDSFVGATGITYTTGIANNLINGVTSVRIAKNDATIPRYAQQTCSVTPFSGSTRYTLSRYFKYDGTDFSCSMEYNSATEWGGVSWFCNINIASTGVTLGIIAGCTAEVFPANDGYYRVCVYITTGASPSGTNYSYLLRMNGGSGTSVLTAGGQLEANSIASSFINTTAGAVTANADVISKTGMGTLLANTKGIFADFYLQAGPLSDGIDRYPFSVPAVDNDNANFYRLNDFLYGQIIDGGVTVANMSSAIIVPLKNKRVKMFMHLENNNAKLYVNGALVATDTSCIIPTDLSRTQVGRWINAWDGLIKAVGVTEELTTTDIDQLTQYNSLEEMAEEMVYTYED